MRSSAKLASSFALVCATHASCTAVLKDNKMKITYSNNKPSLILSSIFFQTIFTTLDENADKAISREEYLKLMKSMSPADLK